MYFHFSRKKSRCHNTFNTLFFFIRTSNFGAKAERPYFFFRFEPENVLETFLDFLSPDDFDGVDVILEPL